MKNDRQVTFSGGFGGPRVPHKPTQKEGISWKIWIMLALVVTMICFAPYLFTSLVHR